MQRLVYYSLALPDAEQARRTILWQLEKSVSSLRKYNTRIPTFLFAYDGLPPGATRNLTSLRVRVHHQGRYADRIARISPHWEVLSQYPILHKFFNFTELSAFNPAQALLLDCDTVFFQDVEELFERYSKKDIYGRADMGSRRCGYHYDATYLDEDELRNLARREGVRPVPPFSCGAVLFNHRTWLRLPNFDAIVAWYAWRLVLWMALHPLSDTATFQEGRGVRYLRGRLHRCSAEALRWALPFPSANRWILEQVAVRLTLGHIAGLKYEDFLGRDVPYGFELFPYSSAQPSPILCHYGSSNTREMATWLQHRDRRSW
jgi:hypothetical protein